MGRASLAVAEAIAVGEVVDFKAAEIIRLHDEIGGYLKMSIEKATRIGELLTEKKAELEHGSWLDWCGNSLPFSQRTVCNYMRCFENRTKLANVASLADAYKLLEKGKTLKKKSQTTTSEPEARGDDQAEEATSHEPEADRGEGSVDQNHQAEYDTPGEADGEPEFVESGNAPIEVKGGNGDGVEEESSTKDVLVAVLRDVRHDLESILLDCDAFTETHGKVDKSILKQFTEEERNEVRELVRYFDKFKKTMDVVRKVIR